jgi:hypothetical protein
MRGQRILPAGIVALTIFAGTAAWAATAPATGGITAGSATVLACSSTARVTLRTTYSSSLHRYEISGAFLATDSACRSKAYQMTFSANNGKPVGQVTGFLDGSGHASPDLMNSPIAADAVVNIGVVVTG